MVLDDLHSVCVFAVSTASVKQQYVLLAVGTTKDNLSNKFQNPTLQRLATINDTIYSLEGAGWQRRYDCMI